MPRNKYGLPGIYNSSLPTLPDGAGSALAVDTNGKLFIATIGTSITPGTAATNLGKAVDSVAGATDTGTAALVVRDDALATLTPADGDYTNVRVDSTGATWTRETYAPVAEDNTVGVYKVEHRYTNGRVTADGQVKAGAGFLHTLTLSPTTATPTAGLITIYDSLTETGTILYSEWFFATDVGHTVILDCSFGTGLYVGYDGTATNLSVTASYR